MIDFDTINLQLRSMIDLLVPEWFPDGKRRGREWVLGDLSGDAGRSLSINMEDGVWRDFSSDEGGADLISLYAAQHQLSQTDAASQLLEKYDLACPKDGVQPPVRHWKRSSKDSGPAPSGAGAPGVPFDGRWKYTDPDGGVLFWIYRHNKTGEKKRFSQWTWNMEKGTWRARSYQGLRPLYNLPLLTAHPTKRVLLVEGEKCVKAAQSVLGEKSIVTTWPGGGNAIGKVDWAPLKGRRVTIWPDADEKDKKGIRPGKATGDKIAHTLHKLNSKVVLIDVKDAPREKDQSWDVADAVASGWDAEKIGQWAKERATNYSEAIEQVIRTGSLDVNVISPADGTVEMTRAYEGVWEQHGLQVNKAGKPLANSFNCKKVIEAIENEKLNYWFDENRCRMMSQSLGVDKPMTDTDIFSMLHYIQGSVGIGNVSQAIVAKAMESVAKDHPRDPVREWIDALEWDGVGRIETFFTDTCGTEDNEYTRAAAKNMYISLIARSYDPGCKVDNMVIIEGRQGVKKSTLLREMVGKDYFTEINAARIDDKDYPMCMLGYMIVEMGELHSFKTADVEKLKSFITSPSDNYRQPYATLAQEIPRRSVFIGTTNSDDYLADPSGGRRFWPVVAQRKEIDIDYVTKFRDQLLAEARVCHARGDTWYDMPEQATKVEQEKRRHKDVWEDKLSEMMANAVDGVIRVSDVLTGLGIDTAHATGGHGNRIARILKAAGWIKARRRIAGVPRNVWVDPNVAGQTEF